MPLFDVFFVLFATSLGWQADRYRIGESIGHGWLEAITVAVALEAIFAR